MKSILEYRSVQEVLRIESSGSKSEQEYLAAHPEMALALKRIEDTQVEIYGDPNLQRAIEAYRQAEKEQDR